MDYSSLYVSRIRNLCRLRGLTKNPRVMTLHKLALAFNMTLAEFLDFPELNDYSFDDDTDED